MKGILARAAIALAPLVAIAALAAPAHASVTPDTINGEGFLTHYADYLTNYDGIPASDNRVTFHDYGGNPNGDALWNLVKVGTVNASWPFGGNSNFCGASGGPYCNHEVVQLDINNGAFSAGTTNDSTVVLRPNSDGNYWVEYSLGGPDYELINVHASNADDGGICLADTGTDTQASLSLCPLNGTMKWTPYSS